MKLWNARSITYKTHFISALCRSLFTNSCWIFATSLFVKVVGSKGYSQLFFFASLASLSYYIYFALRGHKDKEPYNVYRAVLIFTAIASFGCFLEPFVDVLKPYNELLLYFFVVSVMTVDLVGTTLGPMVLQASVNPAIFRRVYQHIITQELVARILAAGLVWLLSQFHLLVYLYPFAWAMLITHFILFDLTIWRMRVSELKMRSLPEKDVPPLETVANSLRFVFENQLVRVAMTIMVWSTVTKFVLENLFYQVADANFGSARQIASFVSAMTITIYVLSLALHHVINRTMNTRLQLSSLLSVQPINVLIFGGLALLFPPFWPVVILMVTYNIIHRSIQLPMSRQCLVPVPRMRRGTIVSLISIVVSIAALITSGGMAVLKNVLHLQDFLFFLLFLGSAVFFVVTSLDSYYIRNLWSFFQETRSGNWEEEPHSENLSTVDLTQDTGTELSAVASYADLNSHPILASYAESTTESALLTATQEHRRLLQSANPQLLIDGLRICFITGFPWLERSLAQAANHADLKVRNFAKIALRINEEFAELAGYSAIFRRKIKAVAMDILENESSSDSIDELKNILYYPNHDSAEAVVCALGDARFHDLRELIFDCVQDQGAQLTVEPIIARMYECSYDEASAYRQLLEQLYFGKESRELRKAVEMNLADMKQNELVIGSEASEEKNNQTPEAPGQLAQLNRFMHTLFLEEYRLSPGDLDEALVGTIREFPILSSDESAILVDMHLSFLKKSELFNSWQVILA